MAFPNEVNKKINLELSSMMKCAFSKELVSGERYASLPSEEIVDIQATNPKIIGDEIVYRILFLKASKELAFIIPPGLSIAIAKSSLKDLRQLSRELKACTPLIPISGAEIYFEYERLFKDPQWELKDISEQITFDFIVALFILRDENAEPDVRKFAQEFMNAILGYLRMPESKIPEFMNDADSYLDKGFLPFEPVSGLIPGGNIPKLRDGRRAWKKEIFCNETTSSANILLNFWIMSYLKGYWAIVETHEDLQDYNHSNRNRLISNLVRKLSANFQEINNPKNYAPESINKFLEGLN